MYRYRTRDVCDCEVVSVLTFRRSSFVVLHYGKSWDATPWICQAYISQPPATAADVDVDAVEDNRRRVTWLDAESEPML